METWKRYLPPDPPPGTATSLQRNLFSDLGPNQAATLGGDVAAKKQPNPLNLIDCSDVAVLEGGGRGEKENEGPSLELLKKLRLTEEE